MLFVFNLLTHSVGIVKIVSVSHCLMQSISSLETSYSGAHKQKHQASGNLREREREYVRCYGVVVIMEWCSHFLKQRFVSQHQSPLRKRAFKVFVQIRDFLIFCVKCFLYETLNFKESTEGQSLLNKRWKKTQLVSNNS